MLVYGTPADALDEYVRIAESTTLESLRRFVAAVVEIFGPKYMREPNEQDTPGLLEIGVSRGFPGNVGSIDCMHWPWKNFPSTHHGMYRGERTQKGAYYYIGSSCILRSMDVACILWHAWFTQ
jgi:hypothetical protein